MVYDWGDIFDKNISKMFSTGKKSPFLQRWEIPSSYLARIDTLLFMLFTFQRIENWKLFTFQ